MTHGVLAAALLLLASCTTTLVDRKTLPQALTMQFDQCTPRDGTAELSLRHKGKLVAAEVTLDFVADGADTLKAELANPMGQTLMAIGLTPPSRELVFSGRQAVPQKVAVDKAGFLTVDGTSVGLKLTELICGLGGVWPEPWLAKLTSFRLNKAKTSAKLVVEDAGRTIKLSLPVTGEMPNRCAAIKVSYALGLHTERLKMCLHPPKGLGSLSREKPEQSLNWAIISD